MSSDREPTTASPADPAAARRAADLSELGDYVRLLADRMGLKDWTFEVREVPAPDSIVREAPLRGWINTDAKFVELAPSDVFFAEGPESRRLRVARWLVRCHTEAADESLVEADDVSPEACDAFSDVHDHAIAAIAAAWAPALPLPLVGWMRLAGGARTGEEATRGA